MIVISGKANRNAITDLRRTKVRALVRRPTARTRKSLATASAMKPLLLSRPGRLPRCPRRGVYRSSDSVASTLSQACENASLNLACLWPNGGFAHVAPIAVSSALGQFEFDPAVAAKGLFAVAGVERLVIGKAGGGQPVRRDALRNC